MLKISGYYQIQYNWSTLKGNLQLFLRIIVMDAQVPIKTTFAPSDLKLFVYGSRQSDQFWLPTSNSHSKRPFSLTDIQKFTFNNDDDDEDIQKKQGKQPIPNPLYNETVYKVACGSIHSVVLTTDGRVFTFGCNDEGALGRKGIQCIPVQVKLEDPIDLIAAGDNHSLFANSVNGAIYFTGNYNYKRGQMMTSSVFQPTRIYASQINITNKNKRIQKLACGANHSSILIGGKVFCRGEPEASTIGRRMSKRHKVENSLTFNGVNLPEVTDIECGGYHTVVKVKKNKKNLYYSWGTNDHGQLGIGSFESQAYPMQIKKLRQKDIVKIAAGASFTLFLSSQGQLYGCGNNQDSNLGLGEDFQYESQEEQDDESQEQQPQSHKQNSKQMSMQAPQKKQQQQKVNQYQSTKNKPDQIGDVPVQNKSQQKVPGVAQKQKQQKQKQKQKSQSQNHGQKQQQQKQIQQKRSYIKSIVKITLPAPAKDIAAGDNFGFAWNNDNLYTWGMGYGYVLLNGQQNDQTQPFQVKSKIIKNHTIYELDAGNQHVLYTSYPETIKQKVKIQPKPIVWQNLSVAKHGLRRKK